MKTCTYCGRENDDTLTACRECGTDFASVEPVLRAAALSRRGRIFLWLLALIALGVVLVTKPLLLLLVPVSAIFFLPIYLPFLLSFAIKAHEWRGLRWSLRVGSLLAFFIRIIGVSNRTNFGDDVGGNIAGAIHNFAWTWGSGAACAVVALIVGSLLRVILPSGSRAPSEQISPT